MVYDTQNRILHIGIWEKIRVTEKEHKLMICLSCGDFVSYSEIGRYTKALSAVKLVEEFREKTKLNIEIKNDISVRLAEEIKFK